ncbi:hypothetical protein ACA910_012533 [Epithemia clementina (nom. ined.)]
MSSTSASPQNGNSNVEAYTPPKVWEWDGDTFWMNRPTAGPRFERDLPRGQHALQLYSLGTPNGQKVTILLEELLASGYKEAEYDAHLIKIMNEDQFSSGFVQVNPNSKIPALLDYSGNNDAPTRLFESASIMLHLAEKFDNAFLPAANRTEVLNWLFWQVGSAPYVGGGFGHFYAYAKDKMKYPIDRFTMETKRQLDVLNRQLSNQHYIVGDEYTIADMAIFPWYGGLVMGESYGDAATFLNVEQEYPHVIAWAKRIAERPAVIRGRLVNKVWGEEPHLPERHSAADIDQALQPATATSNLDR